MFTKHQRTLALVASVAAFAGVAALAPCGTEAVVIRHDKTDADALAMGAPLAATGRVLPDGACTLIAPAWAVTAAHVAARIPTGGKVQFADKTYVVKRTVLHPEGTAPEGVPPEVDLALIELVAPVEGVEPVALYRGSEEMGKTLVIVGYGDFGTPKAALARADGKRRAATNVVIDAGPRRLFMRFDAPPGGSPLEGVGGPGDSGGPAFLLHEGTTFLAGVSSASMNGKPGQYGVTDVYVRVGSYAAWIDETIAAARPEQKP